MIPFTFNPLMDLMKSEKPGVGAGGVTSGGGNSKPSNAQAFDSTANLGTTQRTIGPASFPASSTPNGKKHSAAQSFRGDVV